MRTRSYKRMKAETEERIKKDQKENGIKTIHDVLVNHGWKVKKEREWAKEVTYIHKELKDHEIIVTSMKNEWVHYEHNVVEGKWIRTDKYGEGKDANSLSAHLSKF